MEYFATSVIRTVHAMPKRNTPNCESSFYFVLLLSFFIFHFISPSAAAVVFELKCDTYLLISVAHPQRNGISEQHLPRLFGAMPRVQVLSYDNLKARRIAAILDCKLLDGNMHNL